jgi:hypothetical protein
MLEMTFENPSALAVTVVLPGFTPVTAAVVCVRPAGINAEATTVAVPVAPDTNVTHRPAAVQGAVVVDGAGDEIVITRFAEELGLTSSAGVIWMLWIWTVICELVPTMWPGAVPSTITGGVGSGALPDIGTTTLDCVAGIVTVEGTFTYPERLWFRVTVSGTELLELTLVTVSVSVPAALRRIAAGVTLIVGSGDAVTLTVVDPEL